MKVATQTISATGAISSSRDKQGGGRAFSGLLLAFVLSFLNLVGILLSITAFGGLGEWTRWQFIGLFGLIEAASGLSNVIVPNIWRLPIAEQQTSRRTKVKLAASTMLIPHWGGIARTLAGLALMGGAAVEQGVGAVSVSLVLLLLLLAVLFIELSALLARLGVARPDIDVIQFIVRWHKQEKELPPISLTASFLQFGFSIMTIPAVKALSPAFLYGDVVRASGVGLLALLIATVLCGAVAWVVWMGRLSAQAPREQQIEAERNA
jgi:hypothetical protein